MVNSIAFRARRVRLWRMKCPFCHQENDKVIDSRPSDDGFVIRRRRACNLCERRFTTYERIETPQVRVLKRDGTRVPFDREKLRQGLERACWKRPVSTDQIAGLVARVELDIDTMFETEVESSFIGQKAMQYLAEVDQVAYVRFASVYRHFKDADDFAREIRQMLDNPDSDEIDMQSYLPPKKMRFPRKKKANDLDDC